MEFTILLAAVVIIACVLCNKISGRLGLPMLLAFILLGMAFGSDGIVKIPFDNYNFANSICSAALIFIMFYGGFGTNWNAARPVAVKAVLLSSFGTVLTAVFTGAFCFLCLKIPLLESFLLGAVISSTDAASVFSILRSKKLGLKYSTDSLLEVESGSNDPFSYMLTAIMLSLMNGKVSATGILGLLFKQVFFGALCGVAVAVLTLLLIKRIKLPQNGFDAVFIFGVALLSFALAAVLGGNGYLSVYITGIILGNRSLGNKRSLVHFFDGLTGLMQMVLFFLLGLLAFPSRLPSIALPALAIALFLTLVARPLAVCAVLLPFKATLRQLSLVSFAGLRGAASIVFAIMAVTDPASTDNDIFHIVFFIVLFSILIQGTLLPYVAKALKMTDNSDVMRTFTDYSDKVPVQFIQFKVSETHPWVNKRISEIILPPDSLLVLLLRDDTRKIPKGNTVLRSGDTLVLSGRAGGNVSGVRLYEKHISEGDFEIGKPISELSHDGTLIIMIQRGNRTIIPHGKTVIREDDILVVNDSGENE